MAEQFAWNIHYPGDDGKLGPTDSSLITKENPIGLDRSEEAGAGADDIVTLNQMHVPVNRDVLVHLTSKDVIHSFNLPMLRVMGQMMAAFFATTTMIISIPSVVILTALLITLWGASIRFNAPMLFALAFLPMFAIGGLTGLPLGLPASDIALHDTYYVIGHFHYVVAPGSLFALFAGIYYWFPKRTPCGRRAGATRP